MGDLVPGTSLVLEDVLDHSQQPDSIKRHRKFLCEFATDRCLGRLPELDPAADRSMELLTRQTVDPVEHEDMASADRQSYGDVPDRRHDLDPSCAVGIVGSMLREATRDDLPAVLGLYMQLHADDPVLADTDAERIFRRIADDPDLHLFVWDIDGEVIATTYLNVIPNLTRGGLPYANIENVVVDQAHRGRGIGKQMMTATLAAAWDAGCYKAELTTGSQRESTHAFYRACGMSSDTKTAFITRPS